MRGPKAEGETPFSLATRCEDPVQHVAAEKISLELPETSAGGGILRIFQGVVHSSQELQLGDEIVGDGTP